MFETTKVHAKESQDNLEIFSRKMVRKKCTILFRCGRIIFINYKEVEQKPY